MSEQLDAAREFGAQLEGQRWDGGVRVLIRGAMRAPLVNGQVNLEASWAADVFYSARQRRPSFTYIAESPEKLFAELGELAAGLVAIK